MATAVPPSDDEFLAETAKVGTNVTLGRYIRTWGARGTGRIDPTSPPHVPILVVCNYCGRNDRPR